MPNCEYCDQREYRVFLSEFMTTNKTLEIFLPVNDPPGICVILSTSIFKFTFLIIVLCYDVFCCCLDFNFLRFHPNCILTLAPIFTCFYFHTSAQISGEQFSL